ncbi:MAG: GAF domain-containing protein [Bradymonadales bacterium]|nr:MAG: GAF domain-containing protein [Bradymonadales bacterium]
MRDYSRLCEELLSLVEGETSSIANLANAAALLFQRFRWHWVGFYLVEGKELVLGPFQGPVACTRIGYGKGVCGQSWQQEATLNVPVVEAFPGHIACSPHSKSELVIPLFDPQKNCWGVLDIDSEKTHDFDAQDEKELQKFCETLSSQIFLSKSTASAPSRS